MQSLVLLAELGSIQRVSDRTHLTPGAVHKHLKTLEHDFGVCLYEKRGRNLRLTAAADLVLPYLREMLSLGDAARTAIAEWKESKRGIVRVGAGPSFSSHLLPAILKKFQAKRPGIDIFVETGAGRHLIDSLRSGELDLVFDLSTSIADEPDLEIVALWEAPVGLVANRPELGARCSARDLAAIPFILFQRGSRMDNLVTRYLAEQNIRPNVVMRSDSAEAVKAVVHQGLGVAVLFLWTVAADLKDGSIRRIRIQGPELISSMSLVRMKSRLIARPVVEFIELARKQRWDYLRPAQS